MPTPEKTSAVRKADESRKIIELIQEQTRAVPAQTKLELARGLSVRRTSGGILVPRLHYSANHHRDPEQHPEWKANERKKYTSQAAWDREQEIMDEAGGGELVFADTLVTHWDKIVIQDPHWRPDHEIIPQGGFDHGKTNPTALLRVYHDFDGTIIYAGEYYEPGRNLAACPGH